MKIKECVICKNKFYSGYPHAKYCGDMCRREGEKQRRAENYRQNKKENEPVKCKQCGKEFVPFRKGVSFCSEKCRYRYRHKHAPKREPKVFEPRVCPICGMMFIPSSYQQKYCGEVCAKEAIRCRKYKYPSDEERKKPRAKKIKVENKQPASAASEQWKRMSWKEISAECARLHLTYGQAQQLYYSGALPKDFGKGVV